MPVFNGMRRERRRITRTAVHERRKSTDSVHKYDRRTRPRNGADESLNLTAATEDPTRVADVNGSQTRGYLGLRGRLLGYATLDDENSDQKGPTRRTHTRDALGREPNTTGADSETAQAEKSSAKKTKKKKGRERSRPRAGKHVLAGCEGTRAHSSAAHHCATSHLKNSGKKNL